MLVLVCSPGGGFGAGKTTVSSTIMYALKLLYNIDSFNPDRDDEPNSRNNESLDALKRSDPEAYAKLCDEDYIAKLVSSLQLDMPVFLNGDWAPRIPRIIEELKQIVIGGRVGQISPREIRALVCDCDFAIEFERMQKRGKTRDLGYLANREEYKKIFDQRYTSDLANLEMLTKSNIPLKKVRTDTVFNTVTVPLNNKDTVILDYADPAVRAYIDPIIDQLGLKQFKTMSPQSSVFTSSSTAFSRPRTQSGANQDLAIANRSMHRSRSDGDLMSPTRAAFSPPPQIMLHQHQLPPTTVALSILPAYRQLQAESRKRTNPFELTPPSSFSSFDLSKTEEKVSPKKPKIASSTMRPSEAQAVELECINAALEEQRQSPRCGAEDPEYAVMTRSRSNRARGTSIIN